MYIKTILLVGILTTPSLAFWGQSTYEETNENQEYVWISPSAGSHLFPENVGLSFNYGLKGVNYDVYRDDALTRYLSPDIARQSRFLPDDLITEENKENFAIYQGNDAGDKISFVLHRDVANETCRVYGQMNSGENKVFISPEDGNKHGIRRAALSRTKRAFAGTENVIEISVVVTSTTRPKLPSENAAFAFARGVIRDLDVILRGVSPTVDIRAYASAVVIATAELPWETDNLNSAGTKLKGPGALADFQTYYRDLATTLSLARADMVIGLIDYPLRVDGADETYISTSGSICTNSDETAALVYMGQSNYLKSLGQAVMTTVGLTKATGSNLFLMSQLFGTVPTADHASQPWQLKGNKQGELASIITMLDSSGNCLRTFDPAFDFATFLAFPSIGEQFSPGDQCNIIIGTNRCDAPPDPTDCYEGVLCLNNIGECNIKLFVGHATVCSTSPDRFCRYGVCDLEPTTTSTTPAQSTVVPTSAPELVCSGTQTRQIVFDFQKPTCDGVPV